MSRPEEGRARGRQGPGLRALLLAALSMLLASGGVRAAQDYPWQSCFEVAARMHEIPLEVLLAVAATESNWDADARSHANAHGVMQIQWPGTARHLGVTRLAELYNPCLNIELGARYLRELVDRFAGDLDRALASYNYGPTRIAAESTLPEGARRYVETVGAHRDRISAAQAPARLATTRAAAATMVAFDSRLRAERHAAALGRQIDSGRFELVALGDGRHGVRLHPVPGGLTTVDAARLRALGWTGAGS